MGIPLVRRPVPQDHIPLVADICREQLGERYRHEVADATSSALARAWEKRHLYDPKVGPYPPWLAQVTRNVCSSIRRREQTRGLKPRPTTAGVCEDPLVESTWDRSRAPSYEEVRGSSPACDQPILARERRLIVLHHAQTLPPAMSRAVITQLSGHTHHEAAHRLGVTYGAYHRALSVGRDRIAQLVVEEGA